jgi:voltage-gated potassium channel
MAIETRLERWLDRACTGKTPRRCDSHRRDHDHRDSRLGLLMTTIDHKKFSTLGMGLWWSVQTVTTVGYGDHVPTNVAGRLAAAFVMLLGLAFLAVITAAITSTFVARATEERMRRSRGVAPATAQDVRDINVRFDRLEALLRERF